MVPQPVLAVLLLFPVTDKTEEARRAGEPIAACTTLVSFSRLLTQGATLIACRGFSTETVPRFNSKGHLLHEANHWKCMWDNWPAAFDWQQPGQDHTWCGDWLCWAWLTSRRA